MEAFQYSEAAFLCWDFRLEQKKENPVVLRFMATLQTPAITWRRLRQAHNYVVPLDL